MASKIIIQTKDGKPESGERRVSLIDYQSKSLIEEHSVSFTNGYAEIESFLINEGDNYWFIHPSQIFSAHQLKRLSMNRLLQRGELESLRYYILF